MRNPFRDFASAMSAIGHPIYSDDHCGRLLAYAALSGTEDVVTNAALNAAILIAQEEFNIKGGEVPHPHKLVYWRKAMQELRDKGSKNEWWPAFAERYDIEPKRWPLLDNAFKEMFVYFKGPMTERPVGRLREDAPGEQPGRVVTRLRGDEDEDSPLPAPTIRLRE